MSAIVLRPNRARAKPLPGDQQRQRQYDDVEWSDEIRQRGLNVLDLVQYRRDDHVRAVLAWVIWLAFVRGERAPAEPAA